MSKRVMKRGRGMVRMSELDRLMDEGTVNMLSDSSSKSPTANKKAKLEAFRIKRLQVLSNVRNRSSDSGKNLREKKTMRRRSTESLPISPPMGFKGQGRRASLLATLKEARGGRAEPHEFKPVQDSPQKRILTTVTEDGLGHVTIAFDPSSRSTVDSKTLGELTTAIKTLDETPGVKIILVSSSGNNKFCNGIDLRELLVSNQTERRNVAQALASAVSAYLTTLGSLRKLTILSAHSSASNLFVTSLPLFDLVYASDKSTFRTNYLSLNQVPEGSGVLHELCPHAFSSLVYGRRTLTASEAKELGLVTEVLWPARFQEEVVIRVRAFLRSSGKSTEVLKSGLKRPEALSVERLEKEAGNLVQSWTSDEFQKGARSYVDGRQLHR